VEDKGRKRRGREDGFASGMVIRLMQRHNHQQYIRISPPPNYGPVFAK
jgi:hypothetical protein